MRVGQDVQTKQNTPPQETRVNTSSEFPNLLLAKLSRPPLVQSHLSFDFERNPIRIPPPQSQTLFLGTISDETPTVSDILHQHIEYADTWYQIINSDSNKDLPYTSMQRGTGIYLDRQSGKLSLQVPGSLKAPGEKPAPAAPPQAVSFQQADRIDKPFASDDQAENNETPQLALGKISPETPSVSHLLLQNPESKNQTWSILDLAINKDKPFHQISAGTEISLNRQTGEISWQAAKTANSATTQAPSDIADLPEKDSTGPEKSPAEGYVSLGTISDDLPTVSHLLIANEQYKDRTWNIIFSAENREKPYAYLRTGTEILLNTQTGELTWQGNSVSSVQPIRTAIDSHASEEQTPNPLALESASEQLQDKKPFSELLAKAVKPYYGKPYNEINCYDLVIRGLRRMGIKYLGHGGIRDRLVQLASEKGLPPNSFFNGEGLIEAAGEKIFSHTYQRVQNAEEQAEQLFRDIAPKLRQGDILSFSTQSSGHTGIISSQGNQWTFINSGDMDNTVTGFNHPTKGVGEENLKAEITNWLKKAHAGRQSLQITIGRLQEEKLRAAMQMQKPILSSTL